MSENIKNKYLLECTLNQSWEIHFVYTADGQLLRWNRRLGEVTGYSNEEIREMSPGQFLDSEDAACFRQNSSNVLEAGGATFEARVQTKEGQGIPYEFKISFIDEKDRRLFCATGRDIATLKQLNQQAEELNQVPRRDSEDIDRQQVLIRLLLNVAYVTSEANTPKEALQRVINETCTFTNWTIGHAYIRRDFRFSTEKSTGGEYKEEEVDDFEEVLRPTGIWNRESEDRYEAFRKVTNETTFAPGEGLPGRVLDTGKPEWVEDISKDSSFLRAQLASDIGIKSGVAIPVPLHSNVVAVLELFSEDAKKSNEVVLRVAESIGVQLGRVFERKEARKRLETYKKQFRALTETALDAIVIVDEHGLVIHWNDAAQEIFGYEREEAIGQSIEKVTPERHKKLLREARKDFIRRDEGRLLERRIEVEGVRKNGEEFPLELSLSGWIIDEEHFFAATIRDISDHRVLRKEVQQVQKEVSQRLQDLQDLIKESAGEVQRLSGGCNL